MFKKYSSFLAILFLSTFARAQTEPQDIFFESYDQMVGLENIGLFNGTEFTDLFLNTNGTFRYLGGFDYSRGSVVYNKQYYVNVLLKYDLLEGNLLTKSNDDLSIFEIKLIPKFISEFHLHNRHFVRLEDFKNDGFFELAFKGNFIELYIKHKLKMRDKALRTGVQYSFKPINFYIFKYRNDIIQFGSVRELGRRLPKFKEEIKDFHRSFKSLYKEDIDAFMTKLAAHLDKLPKKNEK